MKVQIPDLGGQYADVTPDWDQRECGMVRCQTRSGNWYWVPDHVVWSAISARLAELEREFRRVFATGVTVASTDDCDIYAVTVDGWPEAVRYYFDNALAVLERIGDGVGATADGDATVCYLLQAARATVDQLD